MQAIIDEHQCTLLTSCRALLVRTERTIEGAGVPPRERAALRAAIGRAHEPFRIVVVGGFNAGKSALINALLGQRASEEGDGPTTGIPLRLRAGWSDPEIADGAIVLSLDAAVLAEIEITDTPGAEVLPRDPEHGRILREDVPRADRVLLVVRADRPLDPVIATLARAVGDQTPRLTVVVSHCEALDARVVDAAITAMRSALQGSLAPVLPVSARDPRWTRASVSHDPDSAIAGRGGASDVGSGVSALWTHLRETVGSTATVRGRVVPLVETVQRLLPLHQLRLSVLADGLDADLRGEAAVSETVGEDQRRLEAEARATVEEVRAAIAAARQRSAAFLAPVLSLRGAGALRDTAAFRAAHAGAVLDGAGDAIAVAVGTLIERVEHQRPATAEDVAGRCRSAIAARAEGASPGQRGAGESGEDWERGGVRGSGGVGSAGARAGAGAGGGGIGPAGVETAAGPARTGTGTGTGTGADAFGMSGESENEQCRERWRGLLRGAEAWGAAGAEVRASLGWGNDTAAIGAHVRAALGGETDAGIAAASGGWWSAVQVALRPAARTAIAADLDARLDRAGGALVERIHHALLAAIERPTADLLAEGRRFRAASAEAQQRTRERREDSDRLADEARRLHEAATTR